MFGLGLFCGGAATAMATVARGDGRRRADGDGREGEARLVQSRDRKSVV